MSDRALVIADGRRKRQSTETLSVAEEEEEDKTIKRARQDLARLDRSVLENYIWGMISEKMVPSFSQIGALAAMSSRTASEDLRRHGSSQTSIESHALYSDKEEDNPFFSLLPPELLCDILLLLSVRDRLTCSIAVCRSWRVLLSEPCLWNRLSLVFNQSSNDYNRFLAGNANAQQFQTMVGYHITTLHLYAYTNSDTVCTLAKNFNWSQLLDLSLGGKAFTKPAALSVVKSFVGSTQLEKLRLKFSPEQAAFLILFPHFLSHSERLLSLEFCPYVFDNHAVVSWVGKARLARRGGNPLLKVLNVSSQYCVLNALPPLFQVFGELEDLSFSQLQTKSLSVASLPLFENLSLPRLRRLSIGIDRAIRVDGSSPPTPYNASDTIGRLLCLIFAVAPNLEYLEIWRPREYISDLARKKGRTDCLPFRIVDPFQGKTYPYLRELKLSHVFVSADEVSTALFPALTTVTLRTAKVHIDVLESTCAAWEKVAPLLLRFKRESIGKISNAIAGSPTFGISEQHFY